MNRREYLKICGLALLPKWIYRPEAKRFSLPEIKWFNHQELMSIFRSCHGKSTQETINLNRPIDWLNNRLQRHEAIHLAFMRLFNIMARRTLDSNSPRWFVVSPELCEHSLGLWQHFQFAEWSNPGSANGHWIQKRWQDCVREEVAPGIFDVGYICSVWKFYVDVLFPKNSIMLGSGYRTVPRYRYAQSGENVNPQLVMTMGKPTKNNYAFIHLKG